MAKDINQAVREVCLWFPETEEVPSRGSPDFRVNKKTFATYVVNHHGDRRIALWLQANEGSQQYFTESDPENYFVPPYVGPRGWLGVHLDKSLTWDAIAERVREAYLKIAPKKLADELGPTVKIKPPTKTVASTQLDPLDTKRGRVVLKKCRQICLALPESSEGNQFGDPSWRAGKKTFCTAHAGDGRAQLSFWVGVDQQATLTYDNRYKIPHYTGHNGWILLDVEHECDWDLVAHQITESYRHFALKRMLKALDG